VSIPPDRFFSQFCFSWSALAADRISPTPLLSEVDFGMGWEHLLGGKRFAPTLSIFMISDFLLGAAFLYGWVKLGRWLIESRPRSNRPRLLRSDFVYSAVGWIAFGLMVSGAWFVLKGVFSLFS
jgi:hypothetical protein